ncbi:MAG TPA: hypothetical protein VLW85_05495 [Myxococcales bacterium]|nr:hypothetical protein [Myxococcales bacterium]
MHDLLLRTVAEKASRLREVRKDLLRQQPGSTQRWFQGPDGCDLFLWYDEEKGLSQVQLTFERRVVEWSLGQGLRTGRLVAFDPLRPLNDQGKLEFDPRPNGDTLELAALVLQHAPVDDVTLALVRKHLRQP